MRALAKTVIEHDGMADWDNSDLERLLKVDDEELMEYACEYSTVRKKMCTLLREYITERVEKNTQTYLVEQIKDTSRQVKKAYRILREATGYTNVEIADLQQESGVPMEQLKQYLVEASRKGIAVLSFGDWSLSSEYTRAGAVIINNKPCLLVRFKG